MPEQPSTARHLAPSATPSWVVELLDVLDQRRVMVMRTALGILVGGLLLSAILPGVLRPSVPVGVLVGLAAVAIAAGVAFALDSADPVVKGPRHVRSSGGDLLVQGRSTDDTMAALAERLGLEVATSETGTYGFLELGEGHGLTRAAVEAVGEALAADGHRVIQSDLTARSDVEGISEVQRGTVPLSRAVHFSETGLTLARIEAGRDLAHAQTTYPSFLEGLPSDIDAVLTALPPVATGAELDPTGLDRVFVVVVQGASRRLDLLATMEKYDTDGRAVHILLIDPHARSSAGGGAAVPPLATTAAADPLLAQREAGLDVEVDEDPSDLDLAKADSADITAPVPRVEVDAAPSADVDETDDFDDDPTSALAQPDDAPRPAPLSPALAARLQKQRAESGAVEAPSPTQGGWQVTPPGEAPAAPVTSASPTATPEPESRADASKQPAPEASPATSTPAPSDDFDPDLLAAALAAGELDDLDDSADDLPASSGALPPPPPANDPARPVGAAGPAPESPPSSITGGLSQRFVQRLPGQDDQGGGPSTGDGSPRNGVDAASHASPPAPPTASAAPSVGHDETMPIGRVLVAEAPAVTLPDVQDDTHLMAPVGLDEEALGGADADDDDPLGMTAALHQFTLERMDGTDDQD